MKTMQLTDIETAVINTFVHYDTKYLDVLDPTEIYSHNYKDEIIAELQREIDKLILEYPDGLYVKDSVCMFCYPGFNAYSFYSKFSNEFVMRYVIARDEGQYRIEPCTNHPIPDGKDGLPF